MSQIYDWDIAAANNNSAPPNGAPEFMEYEEVNNTMREMMAVVARWLTASFTGIETAGTQPAYTLTSGQSLSAYEDGQMFAFKAHATSTGNVTLNVDTLGAVAVRDSRGNQLGSGDILVNGIYFVVKIAASWRLVGHLSSASVQALASITLASAPTTTNSGNAYSVTYTNFPTAYANGQLIAFVANAANTGAATINVNSLGAESLLDPDGAALAANDIVANQVCLAARVSGSWRVFAGLPVNLATQAIGILPVANGGTNASSASGARTSLGVPYASNAQVRSANSGTAGAVLDAAQIETASAGVALTDAATVSVDWDSAINFTLTVTASRIIGNPTNGQPGTWRTILVQGNDATDRAITFASNYLGEVPSILDCDSTRWYLLMIYCVSTTHFVVSAKRANGS